MTTSLTDNNLSQHAGNMNKTWYLLLSIVLATISSFSQITSNIYFLDRFSSYKNGSDGSPIWTPVKGSWQIVDESYIQRAEDYDCASLYNVFFNESYEFEITFKHLSGEVGAGLIFASSEQSSTSYSQMVRFDGKSVLLMGYFSGGEFTATSSVKIDSFDTKTIHNLSIKVDREKDSYSVRFDGKMLKENEPLVYRAGYCGLQSSGGEVQFTKFRLSRVEPAFQPFDLTWTKNFILTPKRLFVIPDEISGIVRILSPDSNAYMTIGAPALSNGQFHQPTAVAMLDSQTLVVGDRGSSRIHLFNMEGAWLAATGWHGKDRGLFDGISSIAANNKRQIFVVEEGNHRVQVLDDSLRVISLFASDKLIDPLGIAVEDSMVYILNTGKCQVEIYSWNGAKATWKGFFTYGGAEGRGIAVRKGIIYLSILNQVRQYDSEGTLLGTFTGRAINYIAPWGLAVDSAGIVYVSDYTGGRIVQCSPALSDVSPIVTFPSEQSARIEWNTTQKSVGKVLLTLGNDTVGTGKDAKPTTSHKITLKDLKPGTTYRYHISFPNWTMPKRNAYSRFFTFRTPVNKTTKEFSRSPMVTLIFSNVTDEKLLKPGDKHVPPLPEGEIERIQNQINDGIKFYWIHSKLNYFLDNEFIIVPESYKRSQLYGSEWWYPPIDSMIETTLQRNGKNIKEYAGVIYITCTQQYDSTLKKYVLAGRGGAFTNGVGTGKGYGISWWDATRANHNAGNNWLFVHEYNHQLDDMFMMNGYPEYWFNHISPTIGTAANFGEHFDANRYILAMVPREEWFDLRFTTIDTTTDSDRDGIPDNAPSLPLDEARLGSNPKKIDSDSDKVADLDELSSSNWLIEGWGETYGSPVFPNLHSKDTDNDSLPDNTDPYPCFPFKPVILETGTTTQPFATLKDSHIVADIYTTWDAASLRIALKTETMVPMKVMLDANTDGWFVGRDNILLTVTPTSDTSLTSRLQLFNATDPHQWPFMDTTLAKIYTVKTSYKKVENSYICELVFPADASFGMNLKGEKKIGLLIGFLCPFDSDGNKRYVDLFEPNKFLTVTLK